MEASSPLYTFEPHPSHSSNFSTGHASIDQLNLDRIIAKAVHPLSEMTWSAGEAVEISELYRVFLFLCYRYPEKTIVPPREVDEFWHLHILDTRQYHSDCETIFGGYLHHFPYSGLQSGPEIERLEREALNETLELVRHHFPEVMGEQ
jgi:hypothetical protein